jgi:hypothetical protein
LGFEFRECRDDIFEGFGQWEAIAVDLSQAILGLDEDRFGSGCCEATLADPFGTVDQDPWWQVGFPTLHLL